MAEGVLTHLKDQNNLPIYVESAGTVCVFPTVSDQV